MIEHRTANPLVPLSVFRQRTLTGAAVTGILMGGALIGLFFFATLYLQQVLGYGPLEAGAAFLPLALTIGASAGLASNLATKIGARPVLTAGLLVQAAGLYWFSHVSAGGGYLADVLFPSLVVALGMGLAFVPLTILAMSGVSESDSGLASGVMATSQQIGQAVGLAILTSVAATTVHTPAALTAGFQDAFLVAGAMALVGAVIALQTRAIGRTGRARAAAQLERQADEAELADAVRRELLEVERFDDVDALLDDQDRVAGQRAQLRIALVREVPRHVVGADRERPPLRQPARAVRGHAARLPVGRGIRPQRAGAEPHEHHVAGAQLHAVRRALELGSARPRTRPTRRAARRGARSAPRCRSRAR